MGKQKWSDDHFGSRVRQGREDRKWSQVEMARLLCDVGVEPMHATTIAKIEAGTRSVRINEAVGIADLFDVSLDVLMGRSHISTDSEQLTFSLRLLRDAARATASGVLDGSHEIPQQVRQVTGGFTFDGSEELTRLSDSASRHLDKAFIAVDELAQHAQSLMKTASRATRRPPTPARARRL
jgi:transcriptional regulator with XRE-family HTH domain